MFTYLEPIFFDSDTRFIKRLPQYVDLRAELVAHLLKLIALLLCIFSPHILIVPLVRQADNLSITAGGAGLEYRTKLFIVCPEC